MHESFTGLLGGLVLAIALVYLLMVVNFQSWLDPLVIVGGLPASLAGIAWMLLAGLFFVAVNGTVRWVGDDLPAAQSAFLRFVFGILFLVLPLAQALRTGFPAPVWRKFILRGAIHVCAVVLWFFAMARIPVAEVTAIGFINPIVVTAGAALFLVVTLIVVAVYVAHKREMQRRAEKAAKAAKSAAATMFADPALIATGLQIVRAVGVKRLIPILVVGGLALGLMASRSAASGAEAEEEE